MNGCGGSSHRRPAMGERRQFGKVDALRVGAEVSSLRSSRSIQRVTSL